MRGLNCAPPNFTHMEATTKLSPSRSPRPLRCPACKGLKVRLVELATTELVHPWNDDEGFQEPGGITKVMFVCELCKHSHTMRGIIQVDDDLLDRLKANRRLIDSEADQAAPR